MTAIATVDPASGQVVNAGRELAVHGIREFCDVRTVWVGAHRT